MNIFRKIINSSRKAASEQKGQVAIVLILVVAMTLIFYAVSLNLGRIAQVKSLTTVASNIAAGQMASQMSSYGQSIFQTTLGGKKKVCGWTGIFGAILAILLIIIGFFCGGCTWPAAAAVWGVVLLIIAVANLILQLAVVQPGITSLWNKIKTDNLSTKNAFAENGVGVALQSVVTDSGVVPDLTDMDIDRQFGFDGGGKPRDKIGRFAFYYTERLKTAKKGSTTVIENFVDALNDLLYVSGGDWGMYDKVDCSAGPNECCYNPTTGLSTAGVPVPTYCNPCCVKPLIDDPLNPGTTINVLDPRCDSGDENEIGKTSTCGALSAYRSLSTFTNPPNSNYRYTYEPYSDNYTNGQFSFRELLGRDDEHRLYKKNPALPNGLQIPVTLPLQRKFIINDTTGYHLTDSRPGIFSYLYKLKDWGINLRTAHNSLTDTPPFSTHPEHCYWFDPVYQPECQSVVLPRELNFDRLTLPYDPATLVRNTTAFVDYDNPTSPGAPLIPDIISDPANIFAADSDCAQQTIYPTVQGSGFWKPGGDRFCNANPLNSPAGYPYYAHCQKHGSGCTQDDGNGGAVPADCKCGDPGAGSADLWPDDVLDDILYGIPDVIEVAEMEIFSKSIDELVNSFVDWYDVVADAIEPKSPVAAPDICYKCNTDQDGVLVIWRNEIKAMMDRFVTWRRADYAGRHCREAWCTPDLACSWPPPEERALYSNDATVSMEEVITCLDYNIEGYNFVTNSVNPVGTDRGNDFRFDQCARRCSSRACANLPRSLIPGHLPGLFTPPISPADEPQLQAFLSCLVYDCSTCPSMPYLNLSAGLRNFSSDPATTFNVAVECPLGSGPLPPSSPWFNEVTTAINAVNPICNPQDPGQWWFKTFQSVPEAANQMAKFKTRRAFLNARKDEVDRIILILQDAYNKLNNFLSCDIDGAGTKGPACALIEARISGLDNIDPGLPYTAIYAWQGDLPKNAAFNPPRGYWHIVKVDVRSPGKCDNACSTSWGNDPGFPKVDTYTKGWGTQRCYELKNTDGLVKVRVTRFDEDRNPTQPLSFPNGVPIWDFKFFHPDRQSKNLNNLLNSHSGGGYSGTCANAVVPDPLTGLPAGVHNIYDGAFILNERDDDDNPLTPPDPCWDRLIDILGSGVTSETCAQYYFHEGAKQGMGIKFVPCQEF